MHTRSTVVLTLYYVELDYSSLGTWFDKGVWGVGVGSSLGKSVQFSKRQAPEIRGVRPVVPTPMD